METIDSGTREILKRSAVFKDLDDAALERVLQRGMLLEAKCDDVILYENMRGGMGLYIILSGQVEILLLGTQNISEVHLAALGPGSCLGEYSLIDGQTTSATAKALDDTRLFFIARGSFQQLIESDAEAGRQILHNLLVYLVQRLRLKSLLPAPA